MAQALHILVTGAFGQLASEIQVWSYQLPQHTFYFLQQGDLSIDDAHAVRNFFDANKVDVCINCAAYTAVDKAETERDTAILANATGAANLAAACSQAGAKFVHISTDYVFAGTASQPYKVGDDTIPVNFYGETKLQGEKEVIAANPNSVIIRTSWVYSSFGNNFVKTMLRLMKERETLGVVSDQFGSPTYAADLASAILEIIQQPQWKPGVYHYTNSGVISWFDFAAAIKALSKSDCVVNKLTTADYPTPAKRPAYSALDTSLIRETFNLSIPAWQHSLEVCMQKILGDR